jgi:hypothetical protein
MIILAKFHLTIKNNINTQMKKNNLLLAVFFSFCGFVVYAQDSTKNKLIITVAYHNNNNQTQYITAAAKTKVNGKFETVSNILLKFYIESADEKNLLGEAVTNHSGTALLYIPPAAQSAWAKSATQSFIAVADESKEFNAAQGEVEITKAKLIIDTAEDRNITVRLLKLEDTVWTPVKAVDIKIAVKRFGGDLNVNSETETYTTDSLGTANAAFKIDDLLGDAKGNIILIAKVEDDDTYGNLNVEQAVSWGKSSVYTSNFNNRTLFARRGKSPLWLEFMAYGIIAAVWGVLIYLIFQLRKIKKMGA